MNKMGNREINAIRNNLNILEELRKELNNTIHNGYEIGTVQERIKQVRNDIKDIASGKLLPVY